MEEWGQIKNSLYRMLWFHKNFHEKEPQVEAHPVALAVYTELYRRKKKHPIYKYNFENDKFTFVSNNALEISADVMNGWRGPMVHFFGFPTLSYKKKDDPGYHNITKILEIMEENNVHEKNNDATVDWLISGNAKAAFKKEKIFYDGQSSITPGSCDALMEFLDVVYTIGNFSPIPTGGCPGKTSLDNWAYKLYATFFDEKLRQSTKEKWIKFLQYLYGEGTAKEDAIIRLLADFHFNRYLRDDAPGAYWKLGKHTKDDFSPPINGKEWEKYFTETTKLIIKRTSALLGDNTETIKQKLIQNYPDLFEASSDNA